MHDLSSTCKRLNGSDLVVEHVCDVTDPNSFGELQTAVISRRKRAKVGGSLQAQALTACGLYNTDNAAFQLLKRAQPVEALHNPDALILLNVAEIGDAEDGRRKDQVVVFTTNHGRLCVGYAADKSPILSQVLPFVDELYTFDTPGEWDRHQTFRSRNVLPRVAMGIIAGDSEIQDRLTKVPVGDARSHLGIVDADLGKASWFDGFGPQGDGENRYNVKTAYTPDSPELQGIEFGDDLEVSVNGEFITTATYARSLQTAQKSSLVFCQGSSGYSDREGREIRFLDLMYYGGSAFETLGKPNSDAKISVEASIPVGA